MFKNLFSFKNTIQNLYKPGSYDLEPYQRLLADIDKIQLSTLRNEGLKNMSAGLKRQVQEGVSPDQLLPEAFALVRKVAHRVTGMRPFDVQMIAGIAMHQGKIAEMQTGAIGKTLNKIQSIGKSI
ncbi:hypothetical protein [Geosporobacter ferrireducens]|uniref:SecA family profile domain-containing protein n=1 Tax=Geosporobacter ferrireducens TaxID=1424294 RepID=A0A1D8GIJ8_9FIRM|nr:hypothetical protein [Geosporobacter ferrireducens]AOT70744.1 hypothetical protein Gferi_14860 [Geosporobacter ferrireducens]